MAAIKLEKSAPPSDEDTEETSESSTASEGEDEEETSEEKMDDKKSPLANKPKITIPAIAAKQSEKSNTLPPNTSPLILKRHESNQELRESKRPKKIVAAVVEGSIEKSGDDAKKKQPFQRVFSEEDEVNILEAMLEYSESKKKIDDIVALYDFVMESVPFTKSQLKDKIKRLKRKFEKSAVGNRAFLNSHEKKIFDLSNKLWGEDVGGERTMEIDKNERLSLGKNRPALFDNWDGLSLYEKEVMKLGLDILGEKEKIIFEKEWRKLKIAALDVFLQRKEMVISLTKVILEHYKFENK